MEASLQRKIELQTPEDLAYLLANVRRAAAARIDEAFPPMVDGAHGEDELRTRIEELVNEYIAKTFTLAAPNLSINGLDVDTARVLSSSSSSSTTNPSEPEVVYEPFDARKRARVEDLTAQEEKLLGEIAKLKRSAPGAAAGAWAETTKRGVREDEEALAAVNAATITSSATAATNGDGVCSGSGSSGGGGSGAGGASTGLDIKSLDRQADVEKTYAGAVGGLGRLKREMPAVVARMERARGAGEYVVTQR
ncbi:Uu.00g144410.m01.CDS01 [Anthostomella pinea]|uniref:Uu.00g144410.m01.CDS01 n=1 Tax=Anthostomella pinea TaxID=933095 RepID=A0AAI8VKC5_9PEZI|nr:Uu.00g144410.m01.CDS01 [Anthostomella pinea]